MGLKIYAENENIGLFDALSSQTRLEIIRLLSVSPQNIMQLAESTGLSTGIVSRHIDKLAKNGIVISEFVPSQRGRQRMCRLKENNITIYLKPAQQSKSQTMYVSIGGYEKCIDVQPPCGLGCEDEICGIPDDPRYFMMPGRNDVTHIWFSNGILKYKVPGRISGTEVTAVTVKLVMSASCYNNDKEYGTVYLSFCENIFCDIKLNPEMQAHEFVIRLDNEGVWQDGECISDVGIENYEFDLENFTFEIGAGYKKNKKTVLHLFSVDDGDIEITVDVN